MGIKDKTPKDNSGKIAFILDFVKSHPVIMNIVYIIIACWALIFILLLFADGWVSHGVEIEVPGVKGTSVELADITLRNHGFEYEIIDSVYDSAHRPGQIVEQNPRPGAKVKPGRKIFLTIVAYSPKMVTVPDYMNVSLRQGVSMFEGLDIRGVNVVTVPSEYKDLVLGARYNGVPLRPGQKIPVSATVTLEVGGGLSQDDDSIAGADAESEYYLTDSDEPVIASDLF